MLGPEEEQEIKEAFRELVDVAASTSTTDLLDILIETHNLAELGRPVNVTAWEFRASWQELRKRGVLSVH